MSDCICTDDQRQGRGHGVNCPAYVPEAGSPDPVVQAWRDWQDTGAFRGPTPIRDAFAAGWDASLRRAVPEAGSPCDIVVSDDDAPGIHWCRTHNRTSDICRRAVPEAGSREGLRAAAQAVIDALDAIRDNRGQDEYGEALVALRAALGDTQEPRPDVGDGTTTDCPQLGVHDHPFRGPHRFTEWYPIPAAASPAAPKEDDHG